MTRIVIEIKGGILWDVTADEEVEVFLFDRDVDELENYSPLVEIDPNLVQRAMEVLGDNERVELETLTTNP